MPGKQLDSYRGLNFIALCIAYPPSPLFSKVIKNILLSFFKVQYNGMSISIHVFFNNKYTVHMCSIVYYGSLFTGQICMYSFRFSILMTWREKKHCFAGLRSLLWVRFLVLLLISMNPDHCNLFWKTKSIQFVETKNIMFFTSEWHTFSV